MTAYALDGCVVDGADDVVGDVADVNYAVD